MNQPLSEKLKFRGDKVIWLIIAVFAMISLVVIYSSTSALAYKFGTSPFMFMFKQSVYYIFGFGIMFLCSLIPLKFYRFGAYILLGVSIAFLFVPLFTGSIRSFNIGGVSIHPSEIAKISIVLYLARIIEKYDFSTFKEYAIKILLPLAVVAGLCLTGSASATIIICLISFIILICSEIKKKYILWTIPIVITLVVAAVGASVIMNKYTDIKVFKRFDTVAARIERWGSDEEQLTEEDRQANFQREQAIQAIQLGAVPRGPGNSVKRDVLPNAYDDYIFSVIVEEYGVFGAIVVIALYLTFFFRCLRIARQCKKPFSTITVLGLSTLITMQAFIHILVNIGIFPVTGQTLPMISRGGTSLIIMSVAFGIILAINRTVEISISKQKQQQAQQLELNR